MKVVLMKIYLEMIVDTKQPIRIFHQAVSNFYVEHTTVEIIHVNEKPPWVEQI